MRSSKAEKKGWQLLGVNTALAAPSLDADYLVHGVYRSSGAVMYIHTYVHPSLDT